MIEIYTDGACSGNPGPGGFGVVLKWQGHKKELMAGFKKTTNKFFLKKNVLNAFF